jgi:hypothetical protein
LDSTTLSCEQRTKLEFCFRCTVVSVLALCYGGPRFESWHRQKFFRSVDKKFQLPNHRVADRRPRLKRHHLVKRRWDKRNLKLRSRSSFRAVKPDSEARFGWQKHARETDFFTICRLRSVLKICDESRYPRRRKSSDQRWGACGVRVKISINPTRQCTRIVSQKILLVEVRLMPWSATQDYNKKWFCNLSLPYPSHKILTRKKMKKNSYEFLLSNFLSKLKNWNLGFKPLHDWGQKKLKLSFRLALVFQAEQNFEIHNAQKSACILG